MAAKSSESALIHRIGQGSTYDIEMDLIEKFIELRQHPENIINRDAVKFYYVSALYSYWDKLKKYLNSDQPEKDITDLVQFNELIAFSKKPNFDQQKITLSNLDNIRNNLVYLENKFSKIVKEINKLEFSLGKIWHAFYFVSNLFCLRDIETLTIRDLINKIYNANVGKMDIGISFDQYYQTNKNNFFPLVNDTGFFTPNTYLYAYFQGIDIIGIPNQNNDIEGSGVECPVPFIYHDFDHHFRIWLDLNPEIIEGWKFIYYSILNDQNLTRTEKELHILFVFIGLHEIITSDQDFYSDSPGIEIISDGIVKEYESEFEKFALEIPLFETELIDYLYNLDIPFEISHYMTDNWQIENWQDLTDVWDLPDYRPLVLFLLSAAYSIRYVRKNYIKK